MDLSIFIIRLSFLALPGLLASKLYRKLRGKTEKKHWEDFFEILLFSLLSYLLLAFLVGCYNALFHHSDHNSFWPIIHAFSSFVNEQEPINWSEIAVASFLGILLAILASYTHTYSIIPRIFRSFRASNRTGDEDLWYYFMNSPDTNTWIYIRDHKLNLIYFGCVQVYSESEEERELILGDVTVYDSDSNKLYDTPVIYISRERDDLTIELPQITINRQMPEFSETQNDQ